MYGSHFVVFISAWCIVLFPSLCWSAVRPSGLQSMRQLFHQIVDKRRQVPIQTCCRTNVGFHCGCTLRSVYCVTALFVARHRVDCLSAGTVMKCFGERLWGFVRFGLQGWILILEFKHNPVSYIERALVLWYKTAFTPFNCSGDLRGEGLAVDFGHDDNGCMLGDGSPLLCVNSCFVIGLWWRWKWGWSSLVGAWDQ
jgi:hypothetical protein